jgi:hypothetical protein
MSFAAPSGSLPSFVELTVQATSKSVMANDEIDFTIGFDMGSPL